MLVICYLFLQSHNLRLRLDHLLLCISHYLVLLDLLSDHTDLFLDWQTVLFQKIDSVVDKPVLAFVEASDVRLNVLVVEHRSPFVHFISII